MSEGTLVGKKLITFIDRHHLSVDQLLKGIIAFNIESKGFQETLFGLVRSIQLEHYQTS
jgi:hypothetical protein